MAKSKRQKLIESFDTRGNGMIHPLDWAKVEEFDRTHEHRFPWTTQFHRHGWQTNCLECGKRFEMVSIVFTYWMREVVS